MRAETGAAAVHVERLAEPCATEIDAEIENLLKPLGVKLRVFGGNLLFPPEEIKTKGGGPYKVFTPFYKACLGQSPPDSPTSPPASLPCPRSPVKSDLLNEWELLPEKPDWSAGWLDLWTPGENGALARLEAFSENSAAGYQEKRDRPDLEGTSRLSPHLHFGEISARACWCRITSGGKPEAKKGAESFQRQLAWREFSQYLLYHWPTFPEKPFRKEFNRFPWERDETALGLWQRGLTGYPIVDAGMRELWDTGWMHNRVRMITASFLVKHLLIPWQDGAAWFWDTLVDADLANNSVSWQWVAGCGVDAAPFFRIFNPILQGRKFDPDGVYVRRWVPGACGSFEQTYSRTLESVETGDGRRRGSAGQGLSFSYRGSRDGEASSSGCVQSNGKTDREKTPLTHSRGECFSLSYSNPIAGTSLESVVQIFP